MGRAGVKLADIHTALKGRLTKLTHEGAFRSWATKLHDPKAPEKTLKGWMGVRENVNETWRETHYKLMHNAIYGFNIPSSIRNPDRITTWHGIWACKDIQAYWDKVLEFVSRFYSVTLDKNLEYLIFHYTRPPDADSVQNTN